VSDPIRYYLSRKYFSGSSVGINYTDRCDEGNLLNPLMEEGLCPTFVSYILVVILLRKVGVDLSYKSCTDEICHRGSVKKSYWRLTGSDRAA